MAETGVDHIVATAQLVNTGWAGFSARTLNNGQVKSVQVAMTAGAGQLDSGNLGFRYGARTKLLDIELPDSTDAPAESVLAELECEFVCEYQLDDGSDLSVFETPESVNRFVMERGTNEALPYIREIISSMATRLGFSGVTIHVPNGGLFFSEQPSSLADEAVTGASD